MSLIEKTEKNTWSSIWRVAVTKLLALRIDRDAIGFVKVWLPLILLRSDGHRRTVFF